MSMFIFLLVCSNCKVLILSRDVVLGLDPWSFAVLHDKIAVLALALALVVALA